MYTLYGVPRQSLKGGGKVVWPAKVKNLVVEARNVVAPFRQIENLRGGGGGRERVRVSTGDDTNYRYDLTMQLSSCFVLSILATSLRLFLYADSTPVAGNDMAAHTKCMHIIRHRYSEYSGHQHELPNRQTCNCMRMKIFTLSTKLNTEIILDPV